MIHRTLENSDKIETTLEEELDFVSDYLDVQQMRFRNSFSFEIKLEDEALSELPVPRHLVHTFVENALKHGLRPLEFPGRLIINVYRERKNVIIEVDDNGIGREEAANSKSLSTGKGLKILDELITLFEKLNKCQISYEIIDKKDEQGKPSGTKVLIKIPDHEG
jgi:LytS/YehU family sensor histidine kinase